MKILTFNSGTRILTDGICVGIANNTIFHYKPNPNKINDQIFQTFFKNSSFGPFGPTLSIFRQIGFFFFFC